MSRPRRAVEVFYDGECPLCLREIAFVRRLDRKGSVILTDIAARDFDPRSVGLTQAEMMDRIRGRLPDGSLIEGVEVFRVMYGALGFGPLVAISRLPPVSWALEVAYRVFAKNRLTLTGRCTTEACGPVSP